jgi:hypothetical protein
MRETEFTERHYLRALDTDPTSAIARYRYGACCVGWAEGKKPCGNSPLLAAPAFRARAAMRTS